MYALLLLLAFGKPVTYTFDPTAIATYYCPIKQVEYVGSYTLCKKASMTFSKIRLNQPLPDGLRINYEDSLLIYHPLKCKLKNYKKGIYECPDVLTGPKTGN